MDEEDPPPPYSLVEQPLQPSVDLKPPVAESALSAPISEPGVLYHSPALGPSPNTSFRASHGSASNVSSSADLDLSPFKAITKKIKRQLVTLEDLKTHLRMLEAFRLFKEIVEDPFSDPEVARVVRHIHIDPKGRWLWFLEMAVERSVSFSRPFVRRSLMGSISQVSTVGYASRNFRWIFRHSSRGRLAHLAHVHAEPYVSA